MSSLGGAVSGSPTPISAKPASATPLNSSSMTKWRRHKPMLTCAGGKARKRRALIEQRDLGADDDDQPDDGIDRGRPEHAGDGKQRIERWHGHRRTELVAHEHGQEFVFELRLDGRAGGEARTPLLQVAVGAHAGIAAAATPRNILGYGACRHRHSTHDRKGRRLCSATNVVTKSRQNFLTKCLVMKYIANVGCCNTTGAEENRAFGHCPVRERPVGSSPDADLANVYDPARRNALAGARMMHLGREARGYEAHHCRIGRRLRLRRQTADLLSRRRARASSSSSIAAPPRSSACNGSASTPIASRRSSSLTCMATTSPASSGGCCTLTM